MHLNPKEAPVNRKEIWLILGLYLLSITLIVSEFFQQDAGWDIDHEIYFGQELLRGNLLWTIEFNDRLPVNQYFFAIAATFANPIIAWRLISFFSALLAIICVIRLLPEVLRRMGYAQEQALRAANLSGGIYLLVSSLLPGRFTHISVVSASMAIMAVLIAFTLLNPDKKCKEALGMASLGGAAAAIGISIRPYFVYSLIIGFLIIGFLIMNEKSIDLRQRTFRVASLVLMPCLFLGGLNLGPYMLLGKSGDFFSGLNFILQPAPPAGSIIDFFIEPGFGLGWFLRFWLGGMLLYCIFEVGMSARRGYAQIVAVLIPLSALSLTIGMFSQHFWSQYINMFSWYFSILLSIRLVSLNQFLPLLRQIRIFPFFLPATAILLSSSLLVLAVYSLRVNELTQNNTNKDLVQVLERKFSSNQNARPIFLAPENMYVHWRLRESRHGFPHASNTFHIFQGLWADTEGSFAFRHPINTKAYCLELLQSSVEAIVLREGSDLQSCFSNRQQRFYLEQIVESESGNWNLWTRK